MEAVKYLKYVFLQERTLELREQLALSNLIRNEFIEDIRHYFFINEKRSLFHEFTIIS